MTSVLVAVYNSEKTLRRCVDSLLSQTLEDVQIICIDDASTDSSLSILHEYASIHKNIDVVALAENHGQAYARNQGIPLIRGEYTAFLDSDDWMEADALEKVEQVFKAHGETDCVVLNVQYEDMRGRTRAYRSEVSDIAPPFTVLSGYEAFLKSLTWEVHGWYVARTALYQQFPYDTTCHSYSDDNITMAHYLHSREVRWCDARYHFVQHPDSCTRGVSIRRFDWLRANESLHNQMIEWKVPAEVIDLYEEQRYYTLLACHRLFIRNRDTFTHDQQIFIMNELHHAWQNIDTSTCLPWRVKYKPAYMPLHPFWKLFHLQQWLYCCFVKEAKKC